MVLNRRTHRCGRRQEGLLRGRNLHHIVTNSGLEFLSILYTQHKNASLQPLPAGKPAGSRPTWSTCFEIFFMIPLCTTYPDTHLKSEDPALSARNQDRIEESFRTPRTKAPSHKKSSLRIDSFLLSHGFSWTVETVRTGLPSYRMSSRGKAQPPPHHLCLGHHWLTHQIRCGFSGSMLNRLSPIRSL